MIICILTPRFPFPENGGDVLRINNIAKYLKSQGHKLALVSFYEDNADYESAKKIYDNIYCIKRKKIVSAINSLFFFIRGLPIQCGYYYSNQFKKLLQQVIKKEKPDRIISHLIRMAPYIDNVNVPISTIEMTDALSKTYSLSKKAKTFSFKKIIYSIEQKLVSKYEKYVIERFPKVVLVSNNDILYLRKTLNINTNSLELHTNGVSCIPHISKVYNPDKICFIGNMRTLQNQDAVLYFYYDIFPMILKSNHNAVFYIIGAEPTSKIKSLALENPHVRVTGFVDDIYKIAGDACVAIAPIKIAAGIQNKVLVSMGMGLPVVLTSLIAKPIPELQDGENCFIADNSEAFALKCLDLIRKPLLRNHIAENGYSMVKDNYSWDSKLKGY